ncbi:MAG TPA: hypothetical protein VIK95_00035 [Egibacteraceae bacterium]
MDTEMGLEAWAYWLVVGFPTLLFVLLLALGRLERWMIRPDERAAEVTRVLEDSDSADDVERAVTRLLDDVPSGRQGAVRGR